MSREEKEAEQLLYTVFQRTSRSLQLQSLVIWSDYGRQRKIAKKDRGPTLFIQHSCHKTDNGKIPLIFWHILTLFLSFCFTRLKPAFVLSLLEKMDVR